MKLFVGYGYNETDEWIEDLVFPLIRSFDFEVEHGKGLEGEDLRDEVKARIEKSRAAIGFATRRKDIGDGTWTTHRWVIDELNWADAKKLPNIEVRERGVDQQDGLRNSLGRVEFDDSGKAALLVQLASILQRWRKELQTVRLQILPSRIHSKILPIYSASEFRCAYRTSVRATISDLQEAKVVSDIGGLFVQLGKVPLDASVQVEITYKGKTIRSGYADVDVPAITLEGTL